MMVEIPPKVLAILPGFIPSTMICIVKPFLQLHREGYINAKIKLESLVSIRNLKWADLVVFCRNTEPLYMNVLNILINNNIPYIYEIDDNFFELPLDTEIGRHYRSPECLAMLTRYIKFAKLVRVYSGPLLKKAETLNHRVEKVFGPIDRTLIPSVKIGLDSKIVKLVYATSRLQDAISALFTTALKRILIEYAGQIECHFWGAFPAELKDYPGVYCHTPIRNYNRFLKLFLRSGFDIGLAPLPDDLFHRSKTNNKFREYGACRIAGIYSDMEVYSTCVTHEETGLLVQNDPEAWYQAMVKLIEDRGLREKIKRQGQEYVFRHYSQEYFERVWWKHIQEVIIEKQVGLTQTRQLVSTHSYPAYLNLKFKNLKRIIRSQGYWVAFTALRWYLFGPWMSLKIQFHLRIISAINIFNRKSFTHPKNN